MGTLVALATGDSFSRGSSVGTLGLDGNKPSVSLLASTSLELMLMALQLEGEIIEFTFGDIGNIGLKYSQVSGMDLAV